MNENFKRMASSNIGESNPLGMDKYSKRILDLIYASEPRLHFVCRVKAPRNLLPSDQRDMVAFLPSHKPIWMALQVNDAYPILTS